MRVLQIILLLIGLSLSAQDCIDAPLSKWELKQRKDLCEKGDKRFVTYEKYINRRNQFWDPSDTITFTFTPDSDEYLVNLFANKYLPELNSEPGVRVLYDIVPNGGDIYTRLTTTTSASFSALGTDHLLYLVENKEVSFQVGTRYRNEIDIDRTMRHELQHGICADQHDQNKIPLDSLLIYREVGQQYEEYEWDGYWNINLHPPFNRLDYLFPSFDENSISVYRLKCSWVFDHPSCNLPVPHQYSAIDVQKRRFLFPAPTQNICPKTFLTADEISGFLDRYKSSFQIGLNHILNDKQK